MTPQEQLDLWVDGNPKCPNDRGECCPDFSCCHPNLLSPIEMRRMFRDCPERREAMLFGFLGGAMAELSEETNVNVYVAGRPEPDWKP